MLQTVKGLHTKAGLEMLSELEKYASFKLGKDELILISDKIKE